MNSKNRNKTEKQAPVELTDAVLEAVSGGAGVRTTIIAIPVLPVIKDTDKAPDNKSESTANHA